MSRLKILALAYACNPTKGSESGVGWGWVNAIAASHDITVITADYNRTDIDAHFQHRQGRIENSPKFLYVRNRPWHYRPNGIWLKIENSLAKPIMNIAYQDWLEYGFQAARYELAQNRYDLVHLITYVGWRFPGKFYRLGIPFVWGPIGGLKNTPWRLLPILGLRGGIYFGARNLINSFQLATLEGPRRALRTSGDGVIAATSEIQEELWARYKAKSQVICEVGPPDSVDMHAIPRGMDESFKICWSGMHQLGKALHLLLHAAAQFPKDINYTLEILGEGPCNRKWRALASRLGIQNRCRWHGWLPRDQSLKVMKDSHVFAITSLKDLTSTVAVEAISLGLPIVSLDHCGFADLVTNDCGIKIFPSFERQIIADLSHALSMLCRNEEMRFRLAQGALNRSREYAWQKKMDQLNEVYTLVLRAKVPTSNMLQIDMPTTTGTTD